MLARLFRQFDEVVANSWRIIVVNRNLGFFTTGYGYLVQIIPILVVAPLFIGGSVEFGVITQSAMAFAMLVGAFSFVITQFQSLSSFAAVVERLVNLWYVIQLAQTQTVSGIDVSEDDRRVAYERLTLFSPADGSVLIKDLSISIPQGTRVLVTGPEDTAEAQEALFEATAGLFDTGTGRVVRPPLDQILFLPERPYVPPGSLRDALIPDRAETAIPDETIRKTLRSLGIENVLSRAGGLDAEQDWDDLLSLAEQQSISFARILLIAPRFAFLDRPSTHLDPQEIRQLLKMLSDRNITYLVIGRPGKQEGADWSESYDAILELNPGGRWKWSKMS
jgi:putative ATP-binding cassette transporter